MNKRKFYFFVLMFCSIFFLFNLPSFSYAKKGKDRVQKNIDIISNPKKPIPKDGHLKRIVFKEELSIGVVEGDENYMFGARVFFNTDDQGNFYVTDWDKKTIRKYNIEGKYLLSIGRQGQGPGEFRNLSKARFDKDGHIYVTDIAQRRISFFDTDGNYLRQISIPAVYEDLYMNSKGYFISSCSTPTDDKSGLGWRIVHGLFDDQFNTVSEFHAIDYNPKPPEGRDLNSRAKFIAGILYDLAFRPRPTHIVGDNDYIYFGYPEDYTINIYSPEGTPIKTIDKEYDPIKVGDKDKEYFEKNTVASFMRDDSEDLKKAVIRFIDYPKHKPAYHSFALMENDWLVVVVEFIEGEYTLFDLFDDKGIYIGNFKSIIPSNGLFFKNGKAYSVATENDYEFVKRYSFEVQDYIDK